MVILTLANCQVARNAGRFSIVNDIVAPGLLCKILVFQGIITGSNHRYLTATNIRAADINADKSNVTGLALAV